MCYEYLSSPQCYSLMISHLPLFFPHSLLKTPISCKSLCLEETVLIVIFKVFDSSALVIVCLSFNNSITSIREAAIFPENFCATFCAVFSATAFKGFLNRIIKSTKYLSLRYSGLCRPTASHSLNINSMPCPHFSKARQS